MTGGLIEVCIMEAKIELETLMYPDPASDLRKVMLFDDF